MFLKPEVTPCVCGRSLWVWEKLLKLAIFCLLNIFTSSFSTIAVMIWPKLKHTPVPQEELTRKIERDGAARELPTLATMSNRLAFQTQLASIMEVLANAAVAEICKLVDDDYAVVNLQMSQCQRENKALKRKLHLLELKMARGNAERRLRDSAMNSSRLRVQINTSDRLRGSLPSTGKIIIS